MSLTLKYSYTAVKGCHEEVHELSYNDRQKGKVLPKSSWEKLYNFTLKIHNWSRFINDPLKVLQVFLI